MLFRSRVPFSARTDLYDALKVGSPARRAREDCRRSDLSAFGPRQLSDAAAKAPMRFPHIRGPRSVWQDRTRGPNPTINKVPLGPRSSRVPAGPKGRQGRKRCFGLRAWRHKRQPRSESTVSHPLPALSGGRIKPLEMGRFRTGSSAAGARRDVGDEAIAPAPSLRRRGRAREREPRRVPPPVQRYGEASG